MQWTGSVDLQSKHVAVVVVSSIAILLMVCDNFRGDLRRARSGLVMSRLDLAHSEFKVQQFASIAIRISNHQYRIPLHQ